MKSKIKTLAQRANEDYTKSALNFGKKIKQQREEKKLSMAQLYAISGVSSATICKIEAGHLPGLEVMLKLGYALDLTQNEIISYLYVDAQIKHNKEHIEAAFEALLRSYGFTNDSQRTEIINFIRYQAQKCGAKPNKSCNKLYK